jgi:AraC-like DNA-binding protein
MRTKWLAPEHPICPLNYPAFVFRELRKKGYAAETLLKGTSLTEERLNDPNARVAFLTLQRFIRNAIEATGDVHLGPRLALHFDANYIGPPAYAAMNAPSLAEGLSVFGRFVHLTFPTIEFSTPTPREGLDACEAEVCLQSRFPLEDIAYFVTSSALLGLNNLLKSMLRVELFASRCEVTIAEPEGWADISAEITHVPVRFEAPRNRIVFPVELLHQPLPGTDPINHQRLIGLCEKFSAQTAMVTTPIGDVLSFLEVEGNLGSSLADAASALGYSERGLRRHLERSGGSFRKLVEKTLEKRAREMLAQTSLPIHSIAYALGYETPSNFARSFKRWTGMTPKAFREEKLTA